MTIVDALDARGNQVCVVGAGGKKTTLYRLARDLPRAVVTATVRIPIFDRQVARVVVTETPTVVLDEVTEWPVGVVPAREDDRYLGYAPKQVDGLAAAADDVSILVKADGARTRLLKAPNESEPQLPRTTDVVVPIASVQVVGKPLTAEYVHRVDRVADLTGCAPGDTIRPEHVAAVLVSEAGGLKDVPEGATVVPLLNMADDADLAATGRRIADMVHERADVARVVVARMIADDPVVSVVD